MCYFKRRNSTILLKEQILSFYLILNFIIRWISSSSTQYPSPLNNFNRFWHSLTVREWTVHNIKNIKKKLNLLVN